MQHEITANDLAGTPQLVRLETVPDVCPRCHRSVHAKVLLAAYLRGLERCQVLFRCTHHKCQESFLGNYEVLNRQASGQMTCRLVDISPIRFMPTEFPESVSTLSPNFVAIYNQSRAAEAAQLDQLVGIGLRKALEFLIKDYAVSENPGHEDEIRRILLGACITKFVGDVNIKECAKRAAWLGNDETHYTRKWETKDIGDLKVLVQLTVNWIDSATLTKKYIDEMGAQATP